MKKKILTKPFGYIKLGNKHYAVEIASDDEKRKSGLSRKTKLEDGFGMFFDMPNEEVHTFQMKETYIPLDMVFIGKYGNIVDYIPNVQPLTDGPYSPKAKCKFVLEVPGNDLAGNIKEGSLIRSKFFDTLEEAITYRDKRNITESLIQYLKEAVNVKGVRGEQTPSRKDTIRSRKAI